MLFLVPVVSPLQVLYVSSEFHILHFFYAVHSEKKLGNKEVTLTFIIHLSIRICTCRLAVSYTYTPIAFGTHYIYICKPATLCASIFITWQLTVVVWQTKTQYLSCMPAVSQWMHSTSVILNKEIWKCAWTKMMINFRDEGCSHENNKVEYTEKIIFIE